MVCSRSPHFAPCRCENRGRMLVGQPARNTVIKDVIEVVERFGRYFADLLTFLLSPRRFLAATVPEPDQQTAIRLSVYVLAFTVVEAAVVAVLRVPGHSLDVLEVLGTAAMESAICIAALPVLYLVARLSGLSRPFKTALCVAVTYRSTFLIVPLILHAFFIASEDYLFALLRGVAVYSYLLGLLAMLPLVASTSLRRRALLAVAAVLCSALYLRLWSMLSSETETKSSRLAQFSLLSDPVGTAFDKLRTSSAYSDATEIPKVELGRVVSLVTGPDSGGRYAPWFVREELTKLGSVWPDSSLARRQRYREARLALTAWRDSARYGTTRDFVTHALRDLDSGERLLGLIDQYVAKPTQRVVEPLLRHQIAWYRADTERLQDENQHLGVRTKLATWGLLDTPLASVPHR